MIVSCLAITHPKIDKIIYNLLSDQSSFNCSELTTYNATSKPSDLKNIDPEWTQLIPRDSGLSYVTFIIKNTKHKQLQKLLKISITKKEYLILFVDDKLITVKDFLTLNDYHRFRYWLITSAPNEMLYHKLFRTDLIKDSELYLIARENFIL